MRISLYVAQPIRFQNQHNLSLPLKDSLTMCDFVRKATFSVGLITNTHRSHLPPEEEDVHDGQQGAGSVFTLRDDGSLFPFPRDPLDVVMRLY